MVDAVNRIYLKRSSFQTLDDLYKEIHKQLDILISNSYATTLYKSIADDNIYIIEYASVDPVLTDVFVFPVWLTPAEANVVDKMRGVADAMTESAEEKKNDDGGSFNGQA